MNHWNGGAHPGTTSANQVEFVNMIEDYLTEHGITVGVCQIEELDHINLWLAALNTRQLVLPSSEPFCQRGRL